MRNKIAKRIGKFALAKTVGQPLDVTKRLKRHMKKVYNASKTAPQPKLKFSNRQERRAALSL
jgi:hypothetical protein